MRNIILLFLSLFLFMNSKPTLAEGLGLNFGALLGYSSLNATSEFGDGNGTIGYGVRAGVELLSTLAVNAEWLYTSTTPSGTTTGFTSNFTDPNVSVDFVFYPVPTKLRFFIGPKAGLVSISSGGSSGSSMGIGGEVGLDLFTSSSFSVGAEINYMSVAAPTVNNTVGNSGTLIQVLAALKYWL